MIHREHFVLLLKKLGKRYVKQLADSSPHDHAVRAANKAKLEVVQDIARELEHIA